MITEDEIKKSIMKKMDLTPDEKIIFLFYNKKNVAEQHLLQLLQIILNNRPLLISPAVLGA